MEKEIVLKDVSKVYENGVSAVQGVDLCIRPGEFIVFVGPSGCGKSTTLRMIAGLEEISSGGLWIGGEFSNFLEPRERGLSMVFQDYALYPYMSVYKNIAFSLEIRGVGKKETARRVHEVAQLLGLEQVLDRRPRDLSGGQRQRVAIGNAIIREPDILLMDEPLSNLDAKLRMQMRVELARLHEKLGNTILYVTHDQAEAMTLGTRIVVMDKGKVRQVDTPRDIYEDPVDRFVASFIGSPPMNLLEAQVTEDEDGCALHIGEKKVFCGPALSGQIRDLGLDPEQKGALLAGIRPEAFLDACTKEEQRREDLTEGQRIRIQILHKEWLGNEVILYFELAGQVCAMKASPKVRCGEGEEIFVWVDMPRLYLFDRESGRSLFYGRRRGRGQKDREQGACSPGGREQSVCNPDAVGDNDGRCLKTEIERAG